MLTYELSHIGFKNITPQIIRAAFGVGWISMVMRRYAYNLDITHNRFRNKAPTMASGASSWTIWAAL